MILIVYLLHTLMTSPFVTILMAISAGVIAYGFTESYELAVAFTVVVGVGYGLISQTRFSYETKFVKEGFSTDTASQIVQRVAEIKKEPRGVLASSYAEGFADATTDSSGNEVTSMAASSTTSGETKAAPATTTGGAGSGVAPPAPPAAATQVVQQAATGGQASAAPPSSSSGGALTSGFTGSSKKDMEFKLGVIPDDSKGGYHIDQGTTVINALNALKPDQIKSMTDDTRKLIETQKNLMSMLGTMKPMLQDGKEMMNNFQEMFGSGQMKM